MRGLLAVAASPRGLPPSKPFEPPPQLPDRIRPALRRAQGRVMSPYGSPSVEPAVFRRRRPIVLQPLCRRRSPSAGRRGRRGSTAAYARARNADLRSTRRPTRQARGRASRRVSRAVRQSSGGSTLHDRRRCRLSRTSLLSEHLSARGPERPDENGKHPHQITSPHWSEKRSVRAERELGWQIGQATAVRVRTVVLTRKD
jgi:hypothetical protein